MAELLTVDVWDTLLRRRVHPDEVKYAAALHLALAIERERAQGFIRADGGRVASRLAAARERAREAPSLADTAAEVLRRRVEVEARLARDHRRAGGEGEYAIEEVTARVAALFLDDPQAAAGAAEAAVAFEADYELRNSYRDPGIMAALQARRAGRVWYVSDFYMGAARLDAILRAHGIALDGGVVSCDVGVNKRRGGMYEHIKAAAGAGAEHIAHIGDDYDADVEQARKHGIAAEHYAPEDEERLRRERAERFMNRGQSLERIFADAAKCCRTSGNREVQHRETQNHETRNRSLQPRESRDGTTREAESISDDGSGKQATEIEPGYAAGLASAPLFIGFALFIAEHAISRGLEHIFFFAREGVFFSKVFRALFKDGQFAGHPLPSSTVLHVSRLATFSPSLDAVNARELMRLWRLYSHQSLGDLFNSLNMPELIADIRRRGIDCERVRSQLWRDREVAALLEDPALQSRIEQKRENLRRQLLAYLRQSGFGERGQFAVVDIGWRGTIQDNLAHLHPEAALHGLYLGLAKLLNEQPANTAKAAYAIDLNAGRGARAAQDQSALDQVDSLEMLCSEDFDSAAGNGATGDSATGSVNGSAESSGAATGSSATSFVNGAAESSGAATGSFATGSVSGYAERNGIWTPIKQEAGRQPAAYSRMAGHFQQAVIDMAAQAGADIQRYAVTAAELLPAAQAIFRRLMSLDDPALMDSYLRARHRESFGIAVGGAGAAHFRHGLPAWRTILSAPFSPKHRAKLIAFLLLNQRPNLIWRKPNASLPKRAAAAALITLALLYKRRIRRR